MIGVGIHLKYPQEYIAHVSWWAIKRYFETNYHSDIKSVCFVAHQGREFLAYWNEFCSHDMVSGDINFKPDVPPDDIEVVDTDAMERERQ